MKAPIYNKFNRKFDVQRPEQLGGGKSRLFTIAELWFTPMLSDSDSMAKNRFLLSSASAAVLLLFLLLTFFLPAVSAEPTLSHLSTDHAVLQRDKDILVWGWADPDERIAASLGSNRRETVAATDGNWKVSLPEMHAGGVRRSSATERRWEDNRTFHSYYPQKREKHVEYTEGIFVGYRGYEKSGAQPRFPFGFGLSYTSFAYSDLRIVPTAKGSGALLEVTLKVKNIGSRDGAEIAQVYVADSHAPVPRPAKELKGFAKVSLLPREIKQLSVLLDRRAFSYYDVAKHGWQAAPGEFGILVGSSSAEIRLQGRYFLAPGQENH